jgi:hypothetical protein
MGVARRDRIGIGGHSYGAFMTANLLAHSDLFRAGIARSGAYNRTLTPFGFQAEQRSYWEATELYTRMSPFTYANRVNEPILLIHGENDENSGTFPIQSERYYAALRGHGATVRYVVLPLEGHGYRARESVMHALAEMVDWMDRWVKNAPWTAPLRFVRVGKPVKSRAFLHAMESLGFSSVVNSSGSTATFFGRSCLPIACNHSGDFSSSNATKRRYASNAARSPVGMPCCSAHARSLPESGTISMLGNGRRSPIITTCATKGDLATTFSSGCGARFCPPMPMMFFSRSVVCRNPSGHGISEQ